jgi:hypothetical protein
MDKVQRLVSPIHLLTITDHVSLSWTHEQLSARMMVAHYIDHFISRWPDDTKHMNYTCMILCDEMWCNLILRRLPGGECGRSILSPKTDPGLLRNDISIVQRLVHPSVLCIALPYIEPFIWSDDWVIRYSGFLHFHQIGDRRCVVPEFTPSIINWVSHSSVGTTEWQLLAALSSTLGRHPFIKAKVSPVILLAEDWIVYNFSTLYLELKDNY